MLRLLRRLFRDPRALGAVLLLAVFMGGEAADARHHLAREGCAAERHAGSQRDDCTCAALHALPLGIEMAADLVPPVEIAESAPVATVTTQHERRGAEAAPRAPPRA